MWRDHGWDGASLTSFRSDQSPQGPVAPSSPIQEVCGPGASPVQGSSSPELPPGPDPRLHQYLGGNPAAPTPCSGLGAWGLPAAPHLLLLWVHAELPFNGLHLPWHCLGSPPALVLPRPPCLPGRYRHNVFQCGRALDLGDMGFRTCHLKYTLGMREWQN
jgi:hypothetical protein